MKQIRSAKKLVSKTLRRKKPDFSDEARRQSRVVTRADAKDDDLKKVMDDALTDLGD